MTDLKHKVLDTLGKLDRLSIGGICILSLSAIIWVLSREIEVKIIVVTCLLPYTIYLYLLHNGKTDPEKNWLNDSYDGFWRLIPANTQLDLILLSTIAPLTLTLLYTIYSLGLGFVGAFIILQIVVISRRMNFFGKPKEFSPLPIDDMKFLQDNLDKQIQDKTEKLYSEFQLMEGALLGSGIGIWELNLETNIIRGNAVYFNMLKTTVFNEQISLEDMLKCLSAEDAREFKHELVQAMNKHGELHVIQRITDQQGKTFWYRVTGVLKCDSASKTETLMGTCLDVSDFYQKTAA